MVWSVMINGHKCELCSWVIMFSWIWRHCLGVPVAGVVVSVVSVLSCIGTSSRVLGEWNSSGKVVRNTAEETYLSHKCTAIFDLMMKGSPKMRLQESSLVRATRTVTGFPSLIKGVSSTM